MDITKLNANAALLHDAFVLYRHTNDIAVGPIYSPTTGDLHLRIRDRANGERPYDLRVHPNGEVWVEFSPRERERVM